MNTKQIPHKETILDMIQVRLDTIIDDPTSADDFETIESLETLERNVMINRTDFTLEQKKWLIQELENRMYKVPSSLEQMLGIVREQNQRRTFTVPNNTTTFKYNDGGRALAGYKGDTGDCVTRAICNASGLPYQEVYDALALGNSTQRLSKRQKTGRTNNKGQKTAAKGIYTTRKWFKDYMRSIGFTWVPTMLIGQGCKVHLRGDELPTGRLVVAVSKHYTAMIDGVINDTYDCSRSGSRCVYGYFIFGK